MGPDEDTPPTAHRLTNDDSKYGTAVSDRIREERKQLQDKTNEAIRRLRDSIDLEDEDRPTVVVNVSRSKSLLDSLRPKHDSDSPSSSVSARKIRHKVVSIVTVVFAIATGLAAALKAILHK